MEINIKRQFFLADPADRFSKSFNCSPKVWREVWKRYKFLDYTKEEAKEYLVITIRGPISWKRFNRWICRTEVYTRAQIALKTGKQQVNHEYFKPYHTFVLKELTKNDK